MTVGHSGAILEKGNRRVTRHLGKRAVHRARQTGRRKREEKVRGPLRERCQAFIDATDVFRRHVSGPKAARGGAIPDTVGAIPQRAMVFLYTTGGRGRQKHGSMGAVSGAPLTVTTYTRITFQPTTHPVESFLVTYKSPLTINSRDCTFYLMKALFRVFILA